MDGDLICSCQDWDGIWDLKAAIQMQGDGRAAASVSFSLRDPKERSLQDLRFLVFTLSSEHGDWRIYDILDKSDPKFPFSLRSALEKDIAAHAHKGKSKSAH